MVCAPLLLRRPRFCCCPWRPPKERPCCGLLREKRAFGARRAPVRPRCGRAVAFCIYSLWSCCPVHPRSLTNGDRSLQGLRACAASRTNSQRGKDAVSIYDFWWLSSALMRHTWYAPTWCIGVISIHPTHIRWPDEQSSGSFLTKRFTT